jgi:hypothetical protein
VGPKKSVFFLVGKSSFVASAAFAIWFHGTRISAHLEFVFNQENERKKERMNESTPIEQQENQITQQHKERRNEVKETCSDDKGLGM